MKKLRPLIVVVGATGRQGESVINALIDSDKWTVRGLSRNVSSKEGQSLDECSEVLRGTNCVFAMTNFWECGATKAYEQGMDMINTARQPGRWLRRS